MFQASKMGLGPTHPSAALPFFCHNGDPLSQPPPAHMGIPPYQLDGKTGSMGEYGRAPFSPADWRRLGPLLAATGIQITASMGCAVALPLFTKKRTKSGDGLTIGDSGGGQWA